MVTSFALSCSSFKKGAKCSTIVFRVAALALYFASFSGPEGTFEPSLFPFERTFVFPFSRASFLPLLGTRENNRTLVFRFGLLQFPLYTLSVGQACEVKSSDMHYGVPFFYILRRIGAGLTRASDDNVRDVFFFTFASAFLYFFGGCQVSDIYDTRTAVRVAQCLGSTTGIIFELTLRLFRDTKPAEDML